MKKLIIFFFICFIFTPFVSAKDLRFIQVTDVNFSSENNTGTFSGLIKDINKQKNVEFVVFTGDNTAYPKKENLVAFLKEAKKLKCSFYLVLGDKDVNKRKNMSKKDYIKIVRRHTVFYKQKTPNYIFTHNGVVFLVADGTKEIVTTPNGYYKDDVLEWIDANLDVYKNNNVIILQHFPIVPPANKENYYTYKPEKYLGILQKHNNVKAVIAGHFGVNKEQTVNGIVHISTAPAPNYRIIDILDCETKNPTIWAETKIVK